MNSLTDQQLLRDYAERQSEAAFAELVRRHVDLVYSAALRMVCDAHLAQDVTQGVFVALAQSARQLAEHPVLSGWLHRTARNLAANTVRSETRRRTREQETAAMNQLNETEADWETIAPRLDAGLGELDEADRDALMLRYFERKSAREMAGILGLSEEAAQKRVSRAVESLREFFTKQRVAVGSGALAVLISANAVKAAPVGLAAGILTATLTGTTAIIAPLLHKVLIAGMSVVAVGAVIYAIHLQGQIGVLEGRESSLNDQIAQLEHERGDVENQLADLQQQNEQLQAGHADLLRLRAEVTRLRNGLNTSLVTPQAETNSTDPEPIQIHIKARFIFIPAEDVQALGIEWLPGVQAGDEKTGLLTERQFRTIRKALQEASDVETLAEPEVTSLEGRQTQMRATQLFSLNGTNNVEVGPVLDSQCYFSTNSSTFNLNLKPALILLAGDPSQPGFQVTETTNQISLSPAQTAVVEQEIPPGTWLPDFTNAPPEARSLLVFVTPTAIDRAGNPVDPNTGKRQ